MYKFCYRLHSVVYALEDYTLYSLQWFFKVGHNHTLRLYCSKILYALA